MAETFKEIVEKLKKNKELKEQGKVTSILFPFKRFSRVFPGWERGTQTIITASSGIGKTKLAKFLAVTSVYEFVKQRPEITTKMFYFALEESVENFWLGMISTLLYEKYSVSLSPNQLKSLGEFQLTDEVLKQVEECEEVINDMQKCIEVVDYIFNPYGIYKYVDDFFKNPAIGHEEFDAVHAEKVSKKYVYNDPNLWVFVATDHMSLLTPEKGETLHEAMGRYSKQFCLKGFTKKYHCVTINIQQQEASKEKQEYYQGQSIDEKLEPSLDGLANNKETQRECNLVLGLFAPERYNIGRHRGYDIKKLGNKYRSLKILKDRDNGLINHYVPLYFNGASNFFDELPTSDTIDYSKYI
jgi:hypothetical protein